MQEETNISSNKSQRPTIDEQMTIIVKEIISKHGCNYEISRKDLIDKVVASLPMHFTDKTYKTGKEDLK